jgi:hypothetical protein
MDKYQADIIGAIISILIGLWLSIYHKQLGQWTADFWNIRSWLKGYQIGFLVSGIAFIILGLLAAVGVIRTR